MTWLEPYLPQLLLVWSIQWIGVLSPGPGVALILSAPLPNHGYRTAFAGFLMQVSNPKAIFFWLAVAAAGGVGEAPLAVIALFVAGAYFNSFVGHGAYALLLSAPPFRTGYLRARRWVEGTLGAFFVFFAFKLATDRS